MRDLFRQYFTKGFGFGAGFIAVLFTAGLLAVAVSTITTFTTGTPAKASEVNANFAALKTAIEGIPNWTKSGTTAVYSDGNVTINGRISSSNLEALLVAQQTEIYHTEDFPAIEELRRHARLLAIIRMRTYALIMKR